MPSTKLTRTVNRASKIPIKDLFDARYEHLTTYFETLIHLLKGNLGAGLFAMGDGFKNSGLIVGTVGILIIGSICVYNDHLLVGLSRRVKKLKELPKYPTFCETISYSFELGMHGFSRLGTFILNAVKTCIVITQMGFCVVYISIVAESIQKTIEVYTNYTTSLRMYLLFTSPVVLVVSLIHTLKFLAPVSAIAMICLIYGYGGGIAVSSLNLTHIGNRDLMVSPLRWPLFVGTVIFSFEGIALIIPLKNEMRDPDKFDTPHGVLNFGMAICFFMILSFGFVTYWSYGEDVKGSATLNLPNTVVSETIRCAVAFALLLSYPLQFYVVVKLFFKELKRKWGPFKYPLLVELLLRVILVAVTYIIALLIPYVHLLVSLLGAVCSNLLALFFPAIADISLRSRFQVEETEEDRKTRIRSCQYCLRFTMDAITIILSILGTVFGVYVVVVELIKAIKKDLK